MKRNVMVFGLISGLIVSVFLVSSIAWCTSTQNYEGNMWIGYTSMLISFSLIFVGIKNYRDKYNGGIISFGKAFNVGILIALIASTMYVASWLIDYYVFMPDWMDKYAAYSIKSAQASGKNASEIAEKVKQINSMKEMYNNPLLVILLTYAEIFPVGLIATLISALILKRNNNRTAIAV